MDNLVFVQKDVPYTDSLAIADGGNVEHRAILQLIKTHLDDLQEFGRVSFEMRPFETNGGVQKARICRLNKEQATFLITLMKNTKPVIAFKKELVRQFYQMEKFVQTLVETRTQFPLLTDNIKLLHENPRPYHFSNECDMLNRLVLGKTAKQFRQEHGLDKCSSIRPYLTAEQIELLDTLQKVDIGLLVSVPDFEQRKRHLEWYLHKTLEMRSAKRLPKKLRTSAQAVVVQR